MRLERETFMLVILSDISPRDSFFKRASLKRWRLLNIYRMKTKDKDLFEFGLKLFNTSTNALLDHRVYLIRDYTFTDHWRSAQILITYLYTQLKNKINKNDHVN